MYRIEVKAGEETVFRTIEELATGIRNGFITPRARIYHAASQKWLPIEFHPHYKKALEGDFTPAPPVPQPSLAAMPAPTFAFPSAAPAPASSSAPAKTPPSATTATESPVLAMRAAVRPTLIDIEEGDSEGPVERYSPVAVAEPRRTVTVAKPARPVVEMETPGAVALLDAPRLAPAPEVVLPNITYPKVPPLEPEQRATARRSRRASGRPLLLVGSAVALVLGGQRYLASRGSAAAEPTPVAEVAAPEPVQPDGRSAERKPASPPRRPSANPATAVARPAPVARQPAPVVPAPAQRMQPGPAFAASVPATAAATPPVAPSPAAGVATTTPAPSQAPRSDGVIAPAPSAELDMPAAFPGESIAPAVDDGRDSLAIKRILKAITGRKAPTTP
jgi:hypothetical protein